MYVYTIAHLLSSFKDHRATFMWVDDAWKEIDGLVQEIWFKLMIDAMVARIYHRKLDFSRSIAGHYTVI